MNNILIINPDQMRADALHHLGNPASYTPNLDALSREGVSFSHAFCQNPVCVPSRCSFMTGLYPHVHGHRTMGFLQQPHEENLFSDFKAAGYRTISSHRGDLMAGQHPQYHKALVDEYIKVHPQRPLKYYSPPHAENDNSFLNGITPEKYAIDMDNLIVDGAVQSIRKNAKRGKPFFMFVGLMLPHPPYQIEQKYYDLIDKSKLPGRIPTIQEDDQKPLMELGLRDALHVDSEKFDEIRAVYLAMCAKVDDQVGQLLAALKSAGIYDSTAVLVFSDHGDYTGDYGLVEKSQNCFPDCLTNVPLLIKPPQGVALDSGVNNNLAELVDVAATAAELAGIAIERPHFSRSLLPTMRDKTMPHRAFVTCEGGRLPGEAQASEFENVNPADHYYPRLSLQAREDGTHGKAVMLRTLHYKYVRRLYEPDEFYALAQGERRNLIGDPQYAAQIAEAKQQLLDWMIATCDVVPRRIDSRFSLALLKNGIRGAKAPGEPLGSLLGIYLHITRQSPGQFKERIGKRRQK
ncbi:MAG: sulfatase-like hydrolase/transferase [Oscillospiraceae bacterium]|jgi:arylsulfatase A-like enzyme|nr:sulfatase-like hydrolase/transferase [Oscillospiraceae bacterium]